MRERERERGRKGGREEERDFGRALQACVKERERKKIEEGEHESLVAI